MGPIPPARYADVFRGSRPPWRRANPDAVRIASNHFGLPVSPTHRLVRYDRQWWLPVRGDQKRLLIWRREERRNQWAVLEKTAARKRRDVSQEEPVAFNPMGDGLRFFFQGEAWDIQWRLKQGFLILKKKGSGIRNDDPERWMAVAKNPDRGWKKLLPGKKPPPRRERPIVLEPRPWRIVKSETYVSRKAGRTMQDRRYVVEFQGGAPGRFFHAGS